MMDLCRLTSAAVDQPDDIKMVEIDFQALCRVCGALGENLTSVFGKRAADRLRERITRYLQIEIRSEDCLPTKICDGCRETLDQFHELYDKCHRTDEKFRSMMSSAEELKEATEQQQQLLQPQPSSPDGKQKKGARNSKVDSVIDTDMKSLEPEEQDEESGKPRKVPGESAKKNTKEIKQKEGEENQEASPETKGNDHLRHAIRVDGYSANQASMLEGESAEESEEIYSDYQFIEAEEEEEAYEDGAVSSLGRAPTMSLDRNIVDAARVIEEDGSICYECAECGKRIRSPHTYQAHLRIHNGERPFQCSQCPRSFRISQGLVRHVREVHERRRTYACEICGDRFGNKRNLDQHRNRHTNERPYRCETCGSSYNQKAALLIHSRIHGAERNFVCGVCSRGFHTRTKLQLHESTHSDARPFGCDQCKLRFRNTHDLRRHSKNHSADKQFQCGLCAGLFKQKRYLLKHLKTQHQQDAETRRMTRSSKTAPTPQAISTAAFSCTFCKTNGTINCRNTFADKAGLVDHLKDQHSDQIFHCEQCDNYLDRNILIQHMTMHALSLFSQPNSESQPIATEDEDDQEQQTSGVDLEEGEGSQQTAEGKSGGGTEIANKENDEKSPEPTTTQPTEAKASDVRKLYCYICEKTLANRSAYSYHINQVHLNIKNFSCSYCSKKFGNQRLLNNHVAGVHSRDRNFTCTTCSKGFKTNVALYNHQRIHDDGAVKFECTFCDKKFRYRNHLTSHQLVHMNERNFPCNQCDKKFNNPECLQKHKLTHVETLPYQCPLCGFSTKQKRYLVMHAKRIHMVR